MVERPLFLGNSSSAIAELTEVSTCPTPPRARIVDGVARERSDNAILYKRKGRWTSTDLKTPDVASTERRVQVPGQQPRILLIDLSVSIGRVVRWCHSVL